MKHYFKDINMWNATGLDSSHIMGKEGYVLPENYVCVKANLNTKYIKEGENSVIIAPQDRYFYYILKGLKANTNYALKFSYATNDMCNCTGEKPKTILSKCGIFNYAANGAHFGAASNNNASGYLNFCSNHISVYSKTGEGAPLSYNYDNKKILQERKDTWYDALFFFNSGEVFETLALVLMSNCATTFLDAFELMEISDSTVKQEYSAPTLKGKTATGSYETDTATTTLYQNCGETDFTKYLKDLELNGFSIYAAQNIGPNKFATYTKGNTTINVQYTPATRIILITQQVTDCLPITRENNNYTDLGYQPLIIQLNHNTRTGGGIGMAYIIRLCDGSFIIVDGGHVESHLDNANRLYNLLRQYTPEGKIKIAAWFLTHCHSDHITGFMSYIKHYGSQTEIEQIIYNFATTEQYTNTNHEIGWLSHSYFGLMKAYIKAYTNAKISTCHSGYKYNIRNAVVDIMLTLEDIFPLVLGTDYIDLNNTSLTFKISFTDEAVDQTLLIMGDSANLQCSTLCKKYSGAELKSTFTQVIHHGIYYGSYSLYSLISPEIVLFPASSGRLTNVMYQPQNRYFIEEDSVKEVVLSYYGTRVFPLPYTPPKGLTRMRKFTLPANTELLSGIIRFVGLSVRHEGENGANIKQALRFKFEIPEHIIQAQTEDEYTIFEYGMMVSGNPSHLEYYSGSKLSNTLNDGTTLYKNVSYNKADGTNKVYDYSNYLNLDDGISRYTQYTVELDNIGVKDDNTDYIQYDTNYFVRPYVIFKNKSGDHKVWYDAIQSGSMFGVMKQILSSNNTDEQTLSDQTYVRNFLDGKIENFTKDKALISKAWESNPDRVALYTPKDH